MPRHRFDPVALVFGAVFVAAGVFVLAGGELTEEGRALVPVGLIALGVALLVHVGRRARPSAPAAAVAQPATEPGPRVAGGEDLDAPFATADVTEVDATEPDATPTDVTEIDVTEPDATPTGAADVDVTEVVDPTERYPRPEPE